MIDILKKKHWYAFVYTGNNEDGTKGQVWTSTYTGYSGWRWRKKITKQMIDENKEYAGVSSDAALISVSYLGYMTREEFVGEEE